MEQLQFKPIQSTVRLIVLIVVAFWCGVACRGVNTSDWRVSEGQLLPEFTLQTPDGKPVSTADFRGKVLVITRFATWCPPCKVELAQLQKRVWETFKDRGVAVIAVSTGENPREVAEFAEREGLTFPVLVDPNGEFAQAVGGNSIPRLMILDRAQYIQRLHVGYYEPTFAEMVQEIESLAR